MWAIIRQNVEAAFDTGHIDKAVSYNGVAPETFAFDPELCAQARVSSVGSVDGKQSGVVPGEQQQVAQRQGVMRSSPAMRG